MFYCALSGLNTPAQGAGAGLVGLVPVLGQGLNPGPAREVPGLYHSFQDLVRRGPTAGEEGVSFGKRHVSRVEVLQRLHEHSLPTEPLLPIVHHSRFDHPFEGVFGGRAVQERYRARKEVLKTDLLDYKEPGFRRMFG